MDAAIQHFDQCFDDEYAHAGKTLGECVRANHHRRADNFFGERIANSGTVTEDKVAHQARGLIGANGDVRKNAKAGVDTVNRRRAARDEVIDPRAAGIDARSRRIGKRNRVSVARDCDDIVYREAFTIKGNGVHG